jgi:hypothetical protein
MSPQYTHLPFAFELSLVWPVLLAQVWTSKKKLLLIYFFILKKKLNDQDYPKINVSSCTLGQVLKTFMKFGPP